MPEDYFEQALNLIKASEADMDDPHPVSANDILLCEKNLGFLLPSSYKSFLLKYGFGGFESVAFCGLIAGDLTKESYMNAYSFTLDLQKGYGLPDGLLAIENFDGDAVACLLLSSMSDNECPVILWDHSEGLKQEKNPHVLADSFGAYFLDKIKEEIEFLSE